ncbi:MAG: saccharopine dehydrogenase C-terminal domain-containing protein [Gemmatimonadota bacterium]|jgi:saccharopine dehydrogenase-like NADP-dependent oxidoreductase
MKVAVLGAGRVGKAMALDLARDSEFQVTVVDHAPKALEALEGIPNISIEEADLSDQQAVRQAMADQELGVGAVPGFMGFRTLQAILESGRPAVDIAFFPEDPFLLDGLAKAQGLVAIVDAGIAPGCSNLILGRMEELMSETTRFECVVGGLPVVRKWPFQYKAPFSPVDVIEEYTRPARLRREGKTVTVPALTDLETLDFPEIGALEAFNTDGLRTLLRTCETPEMVEKTMRYPGHAEWMLGLRESGFFGTDPLPVGDTEIAPLAVTARLLENAWVFEEGEEDLTVMRVQVEGRIGDSVQRHTYELLDRYDKENNVSSMARTTGYTCTAAVRMVANGLYKEPGITPLELVGADAACFDFLLKELESRGVRFQHQVEELDK